MRVVFKSSPTYTEDEETATIPEEINKAITVANNLGLTEVTADVLPKRLLQNGSWLTYMRSLGYIINQLSEAEYLRDIKIVRYQISW